MSSMVLGMALGYGVLSREKGRDIRARRLRMAVKLMGSDTGRWGYEAL